MYFDDFISFVFLFNDQVVKLYIYQTLKRLFHWASKHCSKKLNHLVFLTHFSVFKKIPDNTLVLKVDEYYI